MIIQYSKNSIKSSELYKQSIEEILVGSEIGCSPKSKAFESFGEGVICDHFFMGDVNTNHVERITARDVNAYILTIPKAGKFAVNVSNKKTENIPGKKGSLSMPTDKIVYDAKSNHIEDFEVFAHQDLINPILSKKYSLSKLSPELLVFDLKSEKVKAITQFIQSSITMLRNFPEAQQSTIFKMNLQEIVNFMIADIIGEQIKAKPIINNNPEKNLVRLAEEYIDNECENIFAIQQIADKLYTSPRNIQIAFKKYRNYTPMQFLKTRKLHKAHRNILLNNQIKCTVKEVALGVGIFDLNRFSKYYAELFGELPSATIKRTHG